MVSWVSCRRTDHAGPGYDLLSVPLLLPRACAGWIVIHRRVLLFGKVSRKASPREQVLQFARGRRASGGYWDANLRFILFPEKKKRREARKEDTACLEEVVTALRPRRA